MSEECDNKCPNCGKCAVFWEDDDGAGLGCDLICFECGIDVLEWHVEHAEKA
jgi:hypothetical protein